MWENMQFPTTARYLYIICQQSWENKIKLCNIAWQIFFSSSDKIFRCPPKSKQVLILLDNVGNCTQDSRDDLKWMQKLKYNLLLLLQFPCQWAFLFAVSFNVFNHEQETPINEESSSLTHPRGKLLLCRYLWGLCIPELLVGLWEVSVHRWQMFTFSFKELVRSSVLEDFCHTAQVPPLVRVYLAPSCYINYVKAIRSNYGRVHVAIVQKVANNLKKQRKKLRSSLCIQ